MTFSVLFAGGGTGGHVFPLLAVADAMRRMRPSVRVVFVGSARGMEAQIIPARGEQLELLEALPIKGVGALGALRGVGKAASMIPTARALVKRLAPDVVLTVGGYAAGSVSLAARTLSVPVALLEPNSVLGLANRLMTPFVKRAYLVFPEAERALRPSIVRAFGLPIRAGFEASPYHPDEGRAELLVVGGSQGAEALNRALPEAVAMAARVVPRLRVTHQAGKGRDEEVRARYRDWGIADRATVLPFIDDVPLALRGADVVVARAGAGAISETCAVGRAALYVPYPFAADDHQLRNAQALAAADAAVCVKQEDATAERLGRELIALFASPERRVGLADRARQRGAPDAADRIAEDLFSIAERAASSASASFVTEGAR